MNLYNQSKWDLRFIEMAKLVGSWNKNESTKVGAIIVDTDFRVISTGFNGFPRGVNDEIIEDRDRKLMRTIHAEENAILFARRELKDCSIYINYPPCASCTAKIIQVGIKRIIHSTAPASLLNNWEKSFTESNRLIEESGIFLKVLG